MTIGLTPNSSEQDKIDALNYVVATASGYGDSQVANSPAVSTINNTALFVNPNTGDIAATVAGQVFARYYQYIHFAYANSADGATDFSTTVYANKTHYGVRNTDSTTESTNPTDYVWYEVADGGFGTTKKLFYITSGSNITTLITTSAPNAFYRAAEDVSYVNIQEVSQAYIPPEYITATELLDETITDAKIALGTIEGTSIAQNTITGDLVATNTISADSIVANSITGSQLQTGLLISGDIVSFNATLGDTESDGFWLDYSTGDARFAGNTSIGGNVDIEGLLTAGDIISGSIDTTALAETAVSQTKSASYQSGYEDVAADGTRYYKMPKLKGWENYRADSDEYALILQQSIVPQSSNSTIAVEFSLYYDNDTQSDLGSVALFRSQREGSRNRLQSGNTFYMNQTHNFRNIDILYPDEQSTQSLSQTAFVVSGYENIIDYGNPTTDRELYSNATLTTFSLNAQGGVVDPVQTTDAFPISGLASWANDLSDVHRKDYVPVLGYENNGTGYFSFPKSGINESANIVATAKTPFADGGYTNAHGMLVVSRDSTTGNSIIYQAAEIDGTTYTANELDTEDQLNAIALNMPPWVSNDFVPAAVAVGDNGAIWENTSRVYGADGVLDSQNGWYKTDIFQQGGVGGAGTDPYTGNLYGVAYTGNGSEWMSRSSLGAGTGAEQFGDGSTFAAGSSWVVVGEHGGIFFGYSSQGNVWYYPASRIPAQHYGTTFRSVCFDYHRNIIWVVGDGGTILWGAFSTTTPPVFNTYNSGTTRDLHDIKFDPISGKWIAVGDGIIIVDDGTTEVNGQKVYPSSTYTYDICDGVYNTSILTNNQLEYEPLPVSVVKGFQSATVYNGFEEHRYGQGNYDTYSASNITLHRGSVVSGTYVEDSRQYQAAYINGHAEGLPITFYLMAGAPTGTNVIVGSPTLKITEIKR